MNMRTNSVNKLDTQKPKSVSNYNTINKLRTSKSSNNLNQISNKSTLNTNSTMNKNLIGNGNKSVGPLRSNNKNINQINKNNSKENSKLNSFNFNQNHKSTLKRKMTTNTNNMSLVEKSKISTFKSKIEEIYKKYSGNNSNNIFNTNKSTITSWKKLFQDLFEKEKVIDFSCASFIPKSLNDLGAYVMRLEKFWILWIEAIKKELNLIRLINIVNEALSYLNDDKSMRILFNRTIDNLKITKNEINEYIRNNNIKVQKNNINIGQYDYLLNKVLKVNIVINEEESIILKESAKKQKLNNDNYLTPNNLKSPGFNYPEFSQSIIINNENVNEESNQSENNIISKENKYEASIMTINETLNEETLINKTLIPNYENSENMGNVDNMGTKSFIKNEPNDKSSESPFLIRSPDVCGKLIFNTITYSDDSYNQRIFTLAKENQIDTRSIVEDIERITTTLKKEIEQLKSPDFINRNENDGNYCNFSHLNCNIQHAVTSRPKHELNESILEINSNVSMNNINTSNEKENNSIKILLSNDTVKNNNISQNDFYNREDSFEKYLRETAVKRGEDVNEIICFKDFTPKVSIAGPMINLEKVIVEIGEEKSYLRSESGSINSFEEFVINKSNEEELKITSTKPRRKTTGVTSKKRKSKSKSRSKSKSSNKNKK